MSVEINIVIKESNDPLKKSKVYFKSYHINGATQNEKDYEQRILNIIRCDFRRNGDETITRIKNER